MTALSRRKVAWVVVAAVVLVSGLAAVFAARVKQDDDLLAFLPRDDAEVRAFTEINRRFGGLDVAIVGLETPDVFAGDFLARLKAATARLNATDGVGSALSLANLETFSADPERGGIRNEYLLGELPVPPDRRARILADDTARDLVAPDGRGAVILVFGSGGGNPRLLAARVRAVVDEAFPREIRHFGGAPFVSSYIFDVTQTDLRRLTPWAIGVKIIVTVASFQSMFGMALALVSTALGILVAFGIMGALGVHSNIVLGSMPVILFALGSAYAIHFLARYYDLVREHGVEGSVRRVLAGVGPVIVATGLTTVAGLVSFIVMDIAPMRVFGLFTAIGLLATLVLSLTFVPAFVVLTRMKARGKAASGSRLLGALVGGAARRRGPVALVFAGLFAAAVPLAVGIDSRMDNAAFYAASSPPARAERFLAERFGGSTFIQVAVDGDLTDPAVLRRTAELGDRIAALPGVTSVNGVTDVLMLTNEAMTGERVLPDTAAKARLLYQFLEGKRAVRQLVDEPRAHGLLQVKLASARPEDAERTLAAVRELSLRPAGTPREAVLERIAALLARDGQRVPPSFAAALASGGGAPVPTDAVRATVLAYLGGDEFLGELPEGLAPERVAAAVAEAGPGGAETALARLGAPDLAADLVAPVADIWRRERAQAWARALAREAGLLLSEQRLTAVGHALLGLDAPAATAPIAVQVSGLPVLHQGLSRSVRHNLVQSLAFALCAVVLITSILFRSLRSGLLAAAPAMFTVAMLYACMRLFGVRLDIGTSVLASLVVGVGADYAIHLLSAWQGASLPEAATDAARTTGQGVWTNALMIAAGFFILTLGEARPLKNVGSLTAAAMVVSALATFLIIPALARRRRYRAPARDSAPTTEVPMRSTSLLVIALALLCSGAGVAHADAAGDQALAALDEALNRAKTHYFEYDVVTQEPGRGEKKLGLDVWIKGDRRMTAFTAPADLKGTKVLVMSPTEMYAWLPAFGKVRRIASHTTDQSAFGMAFSQDDLAVQRYSGDYTATVGATTDAGTTLVLTPRPGKSAVYDRIEIVVLKDKGVPSDLKYYTGTKLWKTETRTGYQCNGNVCVPGELKMTDHTKGGMSTTITTRVWKLNESVDDSLLSKRNLDK